VSGESSCRRVVVYLETPFGERLKSTIGSSTGSKQGGSTAAAVRGVELSLVGFEACLGKVAFATV
jgi:hypothetical protein